MQWGSSSCSWYFIAKFFHCLYGIKLKLKFGLLIFCIESLPKDVLWCDIEIKNKFCKKMGCHVLDNLLKMLNLPDLLQQIISFLILAPSPTGDWVRVLLLVDKHSTAEVQTQPQRLQNREANVFKIYLYFHRGQLFIYGISTSKISG